MSEINNKPLSIADEATLREYIRMKFPNDGYCSSDYIELQVGQIVVDNQRNQYKLLEKLFEKTSYYGGNVIWRLETERDGEVFTRDIAEKTIHLVCKGMILDRTLTEGPLGKSRLIPTLIVMLGLGEAKEKHG